MIEEHRADLSSHLKELKTDEDTCKISFQDPVHWAEPDRQWSLGDMKQIRWALCCPRLLLWESSKSQCRKD